MAINVSPEAVLSFVVSNPEVCEKSGVTPDGLTEPEIYARAVALLRAASGDVPEEKGAREAKAYTVILLHGDRFTVVGTAKGSVGRASADPAHWSPLQKMEASARMRALLLRSKGEWAHVIRVLAEEMEVG
jgi:hypothetical protein